MNTHRPSLKFWMVRAELQTVKQLGTVEVETKRENIETLKTVINTRWGQQTRAGIRATVDIDLTTVASEPRRTRDGAFTKPTSVGPVFSRTLASD